MNRKIVFRCDSSAQIGLGHLVRCLAVARTLNDAEVIFATLKDDTNYYIDKSFKIIFKMENETEEDFLIRIIDTQMQDILVIDKKYNYKLDIIQKIHEKSRVVMIDHICDGLSACDEVIFPNAHLNKDLLKDYLSLEQIKCVKTGFKYVIIRDEIVGSKKASVDLKDPPTIGVTTGGSDPEGVLLKLLNFLLENGTLANYKLLYGSSFKFMEELDEISSNLPQNFSVVPYSLDELIKSDIIICTFGTTVYEMIYLQKPVLCVSHSLENASAALKLSQRYEGIEDLGYMSDLNAKTLFKAINRLIYKDYNKALNDSHDNLIDGLGAERIGNIIIGAE